MVMVPSDPAQFKAAARKAKWKVVGPKKASHVEGDDRVGALVGHMGKLGEAKVNITATDAGAHLGPRPVLPLPGHERGARLQVVACHPAASAPELHCRRPNS